MAGNPSAVVLDALASVKAEGAAVASLSPASRATLEVLSSAASHVIGDATGAALEVVAPSALAFAGDMLRDVVGKVGVELATNVLDAVPLVGSMLSTIVGIAGAASQNAASGTGPASKDMGIRAQWCRANFAPVVGSGWQNAAVPADIFAPMGSVDGLGDRGMSSMGAALIDVFECPDFEAVAALARSSWEARHKPGAFGQAPSFAAADVLDVLVSPRAVGIPPARRELIGKVRRAIAACWKLEGSDGGAWLWPLYLDLLSAEWTAGRMTRPAAELLEGRLWKGTIADGVATAEERVWGCFVHERRGLEQALAAVTGWGQRWYAQDKRAIAAATRAVELAREALDPPPHPHVPRKGPTLKKRAPRLPAPRPVVRSAGVAPREVSTGRKVGAVAVGAVALVGAGVGIWMLTR